MPRIVSETALAAMLAQQTEQIFLICLTISHTSLASPIRLVNDTLELETSEGTYLPFPFMAVLPEDSEETITGITVRIDNVDQRVIEALRSITTAPTMTMSVRLRSTPDTVEAGPYVFQMKSAVYDAQTIDATLSFEEDFLTEPFPKDSFTPQTTPGLFR